MDDKDFTRRNDDQILANSSGNCEQGRDGRDDRSVIATKDDWEIMEMPAERESFTIEMKFTPEQRMKLQYGHIPREMEDRWFYYMEDNVLYVYRSWSGICVFIVKIDEASGTHTVTYNCDKNQVNFDDWNDAKETLEELLNCWV